MIVANDEAGRNAAKTFRDRFGAAGGKVLAEEQVALDATDFRAQLAKVAAPELVPTRGVVPEPLSELGAGRDLLQPQHARELRLALE